MILIDSDVLIWFTRAHPLALVRLTAVNPWRISTITYMELAQGCRSKQELATAKRGLALGRTEIIPLTPAISERAMRLTDEYTLSDGLQLADALIAATAIEHGFTLLTGNTRHFGSIEALKLERFEP
jgi:predicted nucleic acid-binding protein